jgi:hypothetical protein
MMFPTETQVVETSSLEVRLDARDVAAANSAGPVVRLRVVVEVVFKWVAGLAGGRGRDAEVSKIA